MLVSENYNRVQLNKSWITRIWNEDTPRTHNTTARNVLSNAKNLQQ